ncbi:nucleolar pre-ribosomal-associated protein 1 [Pholidichthys leucotaenia]
MQGLEKFILIAKKLPCSDLYDVVEGYIKISMECAEIFQLLEGEKHTENELMLIFESLEMILLRTASDLSHFNMVGKSILDKIVSSHMKLIQSSFRSGNYRFIRLCLTLLSALVTQGPDAAREVLSRFHINKDLPRLAKMKDKQGRPDVRQAFVQFVLSFLVTGDSATVGQILEMKEFLPVILSTGLKEDRLSIVHLILSTLKSKVLLNMAITKTQKVRFFTPSVLANIASLYKWNGIVDNEMTQLAGNSVVRELVHSFLLNLCCSRKHGIPFHDASFGTAARAGNIVLLQFLVGLKQAADDDLVSDLVVNVLKASPDVLSRYFKETRHAYIPRQQSAWQSSVTLLKKIYEVQPNISLVFQTQELIPLPRLLSMIMVISLPPVCNKVFFTQGLKLGSTAGHLTTLSVVHFILTRASKNVDYLLDRSVWLSSNVYSPDTMEDLVQQYREALSKILPDMTSIVEKWQLLSKKEKTEESAEQTENEVAVADAAEVILLKALILQVICLYQKVVPHLVSQFKFDFSKLLKGIVSEKGMREEVPPVLQHHVLQVALELPASKFSWFQDVANTKSSSGEKSVFYLLLKMFGSSSSSHLKTSTQMLVLKVLKDTGVFEHTWTELKLWLDQLARLAPNQQETVIQFLERVLIKLVSHSYEYTDKVASLVQEAGYLQANLSNQEGDTASIAISHIDDVLDMLDVIMEGNNGEMEEFGPSLSEDLIIQTFPFSVMIPAVLEARNKLSPDKGMVYEYLSAVLSDILHCQTEPLPLCLALLQYDKELLSSEQSSPPHPSIIDFHRYYSRWLPQQCREELFKSSECHLKELPAPSSYTALMKAAYIQGPNTLLEDALRKNVEESLASISLAEVPVAIKQLLLYIKSVVENFGTFSKDTGGALLKTLMGMLQEIVMKLQHFQWEEKSEPTEESEELADLFMEVNKSSQVEANKEQFLVSALGSIFKHPCLAQWFLALELSTVPPHSLNPVRLKQLCAHLTDSMLALLKICVPTLCDLHRPDLLSTYMGAIERATLKELSEKSSQPPKSHTRSFRALLSLHTHMDSSNLREVVSALLLLPRDGLISHSSEGTKAELSIYGYAALQILTECKYASSHEHGTLLTQAHLHGLGALLLSCSSTVLESFLLQFLSSKPSSAKLIHTGVMLHCLQRPLPDTLAISSLLLQNCSAHRLRFELWCLEPANMEKLSDRYDVFLPLINTYLKVASREDPARPGDVQKEVLRSLNHALLAMLSQQVLESLTEDSRSLLAETLARLIKLSASIVDIRHLIDNLPDALQNVDSFERWQVVDSVTDKLSSYPEEEERWRKCVTTAALKCLTASYSHYKDQAKTPSEQEKGLLNRLQRLLTSPEDMTASEWNSFVISGLKYRYRDDHFLNTLASLLEQMYSGGEVQKDLLPLPSLHMMTCSHSLFLPTMLECEASTSQAKEALISLLLWLVKKCPAVCNINHFVILLGAYGATLCTSDQKLLLLLQEYERNQVSLLKFQSFLWGPAAVEHHKTRKSLGASLWKQTNTDDILGLLKPDRMLQTIAHFPMLRKIVLQDGNESLFNSNAVKDLGNLYDPGFLLPLFSAILRPECVIDCLKFVSSHAFGVTVMALSSCDPDMRAAAYYVLSCYYQHLEGARFRERRQLLYLMDMVKNGVHQENQRVPFVLTTYITKVAWQMLRPEDHMYVALNKFLLSHQSLDLRRVPEFFKFFYGFDLEHKLEREWILSVLEQGLSDGRCYELCNQQGIFQILLTFASSPLCDENFLAQIMRVMCQAAHVTKAASDLTKSSGLLSWIMQVVEKRNLDKQLLCAIIDLLHMLWSTNLGHKEKAVASKTKKPRNVMNYLTLPLISEFLCVASAISRHLRLGVKAAHLSLFLQTLLSVLKHRSAALGVHTKAGYLTVNPQPLSCADTLALLYSWASLSHSTALLTQIHTLSEKHKIKGLMGMGKDKTRSQGSISSSFSRKVSLAEDTEAEKQEESLLAECKLCLCGIFTHWEPAFHSFKPQTAQPGGELHPSQLASDTAHLLTKWSLRCLVEDLFDENRAKEFLCWFEKAVIKHREIVDVVLPDLNLKADLLRLYHQVFEAQCDCGFSLRSEVCQRFTKIMICLLETRGSLPEMHQSVSSICFPEDKCDQSRIDAGMCLLSLYIHELWSGAASPELFLSHVDLVTKTKCKSQKASKSSPSQMAIRDICNDMKTMKR